ncbi:MAG: hypothetical protein U0T73_09245 [Chitinophagales bacterium]
MNANTSLIEMAQLLYKQSKSPKEIEQDLCTAGHPAEDVRKVLRQLEHDRNSHTGMILIGIGVVLCITGFISCLLMTNCDGVFHAALYGITGTGGICMLIGLAFIIGL